LTELFLLRLFLEVLANAAVEVFGGFYAFELRRHVQLVSGVIRATMNLENRIILAVAYPEQLN
jgi:hypothetical protein